MRFVAAVIAAMGLATAQPAHACWFDFCLMDPECRAAMQEGDAALQAWLDNQTAESNRRFTEALSAWANLGDPLGEEILVTRHNLLVFLQYQARTFDPARFGDILDDMSQAQFQQLIADYAREEALYREARRLGHDRNRFFMTRRSLIEQLELITPGFGEAAGKLRDEDIERFFEDHSDEYAKSADATFAHVYFSVDGHGEAEAERLAKNELQRLNREKVPFHRAMAQGDYPPTGVNYVGAGEERVASDFSEDMASALFALDPADTVWRGPFRSEDGYHLVLLTRRQDRKIPPLEEVRERVAMDARKALQRQRVDEAIDAIVSAYDVKLADIRLVARRPEHG